LRSAESGKLWTSVKARYRNLIKLEENTALFSKQGIYVSIHLLKGKVDEISYYRKYAKESTKNCPPTDAEVQVLLNVNAQHSKWELQGTYWHHALWINRERGLSAFSTERALTISISDPVVFRARHERNAAATRL
jgi:hypothetical protein